MLRCKVKFLSSNFELTGARGIVFLTDQEEFEIVGGFDCQQASCQPSTTEVRCSVCLMRKVPCRSVGGLH